MADSLPLAADPGGPSAGGQPAAAPTVVIQNQPPRQPWLGRAILKLLLVVSVVGNVTLYGFYQVYYPALDSSEVFKDGDRYADQKVAIIKVVGMITRATVAAPVRELKRAAKDENLHAVVLAVDSPGGTISGSDILYHAVEKFKSQTEKPLVVSMQGMGASGAYYISVPADVILAERSCVTGSIGVIASLMHFEELLTKIGVVSEVVKSGKLKDSGSPMRAMTPEERAEWQGLIDKMFAQFLGVVVKHRGERITGGAKALRELEGRVLLADDALAAGLIDGIGYQEDAVTRAKKLAGLVGEVRIVTYYRPLGGYLSLLTGSAKTPNGFDWNALAEMQIPRLLLLPTPVVGLRD